MRSREKLTGVMEGDRCCKWEPAELTWAWRCGRLRGSRRWCGQSTGYLPGIEALCKAIDLSMGSAQTTLFGLPWAQSPHLNWQNHKLFPGVFLLNIHFPFPLKKALRNPTNITNHVLSRHGLGDPHFLLGFWINCVHSLLICSTVNILKSQGI